MGPCHSWRWVSGAAPRHSWLGSAGRGGGCFRGWGFPVLCVLVARRVRVVPVLVCVVCPRRCYQKAKGRDVYPRVKVNGLGCVCCVRAVRKCVGLGRGRGSR